MGLKDRRSLKAVVPPKEEKKVEKKAPVKVVKAEKIEKTKKEKKVEAPEVVPVVETVVTKQKKEWDGLGFVGSAPFVNEFKGKVKMKGLILGEVLMQLLKDWNAKN